MDAPGRKKKKAAKKLQELKALEKAWSVPWMCHGSRGWLVLPILGGTEEVSYYTARELGLLLRQSTGPWTAFLLTKQVYGNPNGCIIEQQPPHLNKPPLVHRTRGLQGANKPPTNNTSPLATPVYQPGLGFPGNGSNAR